MQRYQRRIFAVALGMVHDPDEARDVCQEAFLKVYRNLDRFEGGARFFTWLYRIVVNVAIDHLRKKRGEQVAFDDTQAQAAAEEGGVAPIRLGLDPQRALADKELRQRILKALTALSPDHRAVLILREVEGLSYQEMADELGCAIGTVMSRLFHARRKMQKMLERST